MIIFQDQSSEVCWLVQNLCKFISLTKMNVFKNLRFFYSLTVTESNLSLFRDNEEKVQNTCTL